MFGQFLSAIFEVNKCTWFGHYCFQVTQQCQEQFFNHLRVYAILTFTYLKFKFADSKSPFLYNPLEAKDKADANNTDKPAALWVAGETATVEIEIWNPTAQTIKAIPDTWFFWIQHLSGLRHNDIYLSSHLSSSDTLCHQ